MFPAKREKFQKDTSLKERDFLFRGQMKMLEMYFLKRKRISFQEGKIQKDLFSEEGDFRKTYFKQERL